MVMIKPRLPSSNKWVQFPIELIAQIHAVFQKAFAKKLKGFEWFVEGQIYPGETLLRVGFGQKQSLRHRHYILSWDTTPESQLIEQVHQAVDFLDTLISEHIAGELKDLPRDWKPIKTPIEAANCYFQYSTENLNLERLADQLLGQESESKLTQGDWEDR